MTSNIRFAGKLTDYDYVLNRIPRAQAQQVREQVAKLPDYMTLALSEFTSKDAKVGKWVDIKAELIASRENQEWVVSPSHRSQTTSVPLKLSRFLRPLAFRKALREARFNIIQSVLTTFAPAFEREVAQSLEAQKKWAAFRDKPIREFFNEIVAAEAQAQKAQKPEEPPKPVVEAIAEPQVPAQTQAPVIQPKVDASATEQEPVVVTA